MKEMQSFPDKKILEEVPDVAEIVEAVFGCKWSLRILQQFESKPATN